MQPCSDQADPCEDDNTQAVRRHSVNQIFLTLTLIYVLVPILMVILSLILRPQVNRIVNVVVSLLYMISVIVSCIVEVILLGAIARSAWRWPPPAPGMDG